MYPIYFYPKSHVAEYRATQKLNRVDVDVTKTQPADLRIWSDPFKSQPGK
jgi:hypothetical protein